MRLEEMKNNIPETPDFIHKMVQEEVSRQLQDTKVVPMKKRKWNKVQAAAGKLPCGDRNSGRWWNIRAAPGTDS